MEFVRAIEIALLIYLGYFLLIEIIIPACLGRKVFPMFRKTGKLDAELVDANQDVYDAQLAKEVEARRSEVTPKE
jgi:hypothetical protein